MAEGRKWVGSKGPSVSLKVCLYVFMQLICRVLSSVSDLTSIWIVYINLTMLCYMTQCNILIMTINTVLKGSVIKSNCTQLRLTTHRLGNLRISTVDKSTLNMLQGMTQHQQSSLSQVSCSIILPFILYCFLPLLLCNQFFPTPCLSYSPLYIYFWS